MNWHIDHTLMKAYLHDGLDGIAAASVEQHLLACGACRATLAAAAPLPGPERDELWLAIREAVEAPELTPIERLASWLRVSASDARLLAVAPALRPSWFWALALASALALLAARVGDADAIALFLLVAPLAPLAGIALAFGPLADPAHELVAAAPYSMLRLLLLRGAAVLLTSIPVVAVAAALLPVQAWVAVGWLLPALAFALAALALSAWIPLEHSAAGIGVGWAVAIGAAALGRGAAADVLAPRLQPLYLFLALLAIAVILVRSRSARPTWRNR